MYDFLQRFRTQNISEYSSVPFWSWNDTLEDSELIAQIHAMKEAGIRGFIMHARTGLLVEYLSDQWFHCIEVCLKEAKKLGMHALVYDENGWPSGFAGGALLTNPEHLAQYLTYEIRDSFDPAAAAVYTLDDQKTVTRLSGPCDTVKEYHCVYIKSSPANTDILNPELVQAFIDCTYEPYYTRFASYFGKELWGFFTDEPQFYRWATPYSKIAASAWKERYGTDIRDGLLYLFLGTEAGFSFCTRYYALLNELYVHNYYEKINSWCVTHGCQFTGHSVEESSLKNQMLGAASVTPSYEYETIPAIDHLGRVPRARLSGKQIGSAAQQLGKKHVLTETFGCCGWDTTPRELCRIADSQYVRGVNMMCQHLSSYSLRGQGKVDYPPSFSRHNPWWKDMAVFNEHYDRLGFMIANSRELVNTLVINPVCSVWLDYTRADVAPDPDKTDRRMDALYLELTRRAISYHLGDETLMRKYGHVEGSRFVVGQCRYNSIILPYCRSLMPSTKALLEQFVAGGGHVYVYDGIPAYTEGVPDDYSFLTESLSEHYADILAQEPLSLKVSDSLPYSYRQGDGYRMLMVVNEQEKPVEFTLPDDSFAILDLHTLQTCAAPRASVLDPGASLVMLRRKDTEFVPAAPCYGGETADLTDSFRFQEGSDNSIILDQVQVSFNGTDYDMPHDVHEVFDRLVQENFQGTLWVKYKFEVREPGSRLRLLAECSRQQQFSLNGHLLSMEASSFDVYFQEADLQRFVKVGENELTYQVDWYQSPNVRYALFDPDATESLRNCLVYDTEIEPCYLLGDFKVDENRALIADDGKVGLRDITQWGYKYFRGHKTFTARITAPKAHARLILEGRYMTCRIRINGQEQPASVLEQTVPVTLVPGKENELELTLVSSNRNLFGPHHLGCEPLGVHPGSFTFRTTWKNGCSPNYHPDYCTVPFGLTRVILEFEK